MLYICQLDYRHIPYVHNTDKGGVPSERQNIATSGCGLCSACMIVDHLTTKTLSLEEAVQLSESNGANRWIGTSMKVLAPILGQQFDLEVAMSSDPEEMVRHLQAGGEIIVHVRKGDREVGLFTNGGHYMVIVSTDGKEVCILDPGYKEGKFDIEGRRGKVRVDQAPFLYCSIETLMEEVRKDGPAFYMFKRK